ncbi:MAG: tetratricopeptide repeat protein [Dehalococcoidia bacterium]|nr:tetratricopeptide repeat protein [Dehalococcoidia bacterium]
MYLNGDYHRAIADFDTAISILPDNPYLYLFRGLAYYMKVGYKRAFSDFDRAIAIDPDDPYFHFFRSVSLEALGEENEYEKYFVLLEDKYDIGLTLRLLLPSQKSLAQIAAD